MAGGSGRLKRRRIVTSDVQRLKDWFERESRGARSDSRDPSLHPMKAAALRGVSGGYARAAERLRSLLAGNSVTPEGKVRSRDPHPYDNWGGLPMPNDEFEDGIVIASCWQNDDPVFGAVWYTLLVLNTSAPHYSVVDVREGVVDYSTEYENIVPAAEAYRESIGGY